jgi:antitoxin CptB
MDLKTRAGLRTFFHWDAMKEVGKVEAGANLWRRAMRGGEPMTGTTRSSDGLDERRRKLLFRCWHRGLREMDLIMGRFADATVEQLTHDELTDLEQLMEAPDRELLAWVTGETEVPSNYDTALFRRLRDFNHGRERTE